MTDEVTTAQQRVDAALVECDVANMALGAARTEETELMQALKEALDSERIAAENGEPTAELTARVRDSQDVLRLHAYRLKKLETDAAVKQSDYENKLRVLYLKQEAAAHVRLGTAADAFEAALSTAVDAKRTYLSALADVRGAAAVADRNILDFRADNVGRVIRWRVTLDLLPNELLSGKSFQGQPIESAADIKKIIGMDRMPLIR